MLRPGYLFFDNQQRRDARYGVCTNAHLTMLPAHQFWKTPRAYF
jgi:hypothetical protein